MAPARILVVDDDLPLLRASERGLKMMGHTIVTMFNPTEALELFKKGERFDVVVSDLEMPRMHGDALCREVQKIAPTPFILVSGNTDVHRRATACGAAQSFDKPYSPADLRTAITELIGKPVTA